MYGFMKAWLANILGDTRKIESKEKNKKTCRSDNSIHIPLDLIIVDIFSKLPVKSLVRLQCLSKLWSSLITDSIMNWSLTKPRLLVIFHQNQSLFSFSSYPLSMDQEISISEEQDSHAIVHGLNCNIVFQYIQGLICCLSRSGQFAIYNPTTRQSVLLPEIKPVGRSFIDGLFGYDPVENQYKVLCMIRGTQTNLEDSYKVFTLGDPKKQWRNIQGFGQYLSPTMTTRVCINGKVYFRASIGRYGNIPKPNSSRNLLLSFDVRSERFNHVKIPKQSQNLTLVNYQGKLGCIDCNDDSAEMWIMDNQTEKQEWLKNVFFMSHPQLKSLGSCTCIAGVTLNGEVVIMPNKLDNAQTSSLYAFYYDPKQNKTRKVEFETTMDKELQNQEEVCIIGVPDHVDNIMSLLDSSH